MLPEKKILDMKCYFSCDGSCYSTPENIAYLIDHRPNEIFDGEVCCGTELDKTECPIYQLQSKVTKVD